MIIKLDFDGTVVKHRFPKIGEDNPFAIQTLLDLQERHVIHLNTKRVEYGYLREAENYLKSRGVKILQVCNPKIHPSKWDWGKIERTKIIWIDDIADNIPMKNHMVDWEKIRQEFRHKGVI